ncbi:serine/threonine protein kinase [Mycobacterium asiaticum]|uniref:non-specific serine/threonine protein kinase n=1 Tax=Mycobacterium asiaticum TaxID=1790 RepID=A0A1A3P4E3_MYCAS|nr:serine/threonine-protein kinase PknD [Mycobacterium asiaticum]OBK27462.1 serine/threonine protein kinase [Mycobacterium asiaticum]
MQDTSFGKYRLIELMGRGGMGEVWRAYDADTDRIVALKILPAAVSNDEVFQQRFRREAHATARLNNPHLIPIHTYGEIGGRLYVDMRLIEGRDLQAELSHGPMPAGRAVGIIEQVAKGLHSAHRDGLLHRDVKPSNILIDGDDFAYLIDFGIARAADDLHLTATGNFVGTYHYMAPERFTAASIDARSDIYSLTCVLYECLTAQSPFPGETLQQQITGHRTAPPPRPSSTNPGLPGELDDVIARGMAKHPEARYDTAVELARAAQDALASPAPQTLRIQAPGYDYGVRPDTRRQSHPSSPTQPPLQRTSAPPPQRTSAPPPQRPPAPPPQRTSAPPPQRTSAPPPQRPSTPPPPQQPPRLPSHPEASPQQDHQPTMARPLPAFSTSGPPEPPASRTTQPPPPPSPPWWRRKAVAIAGAITVITAVVLAIVVFTSSSGPKGDEYEQVTLPFVGLNNPQGLSVDSGGTVYVADTPKNRILALFAGSNSPVVLPFDGLNYPTGVTADKTGTVYVNDAGNKRVLVLRSGKQEVLPFTDLENPTGLSVDGSFTVYVTDTAKNRVVALAKGSNAQTEIPFTGLNAPTGLVVNGSGTVYVSDGGNNRVLMLPMDTKKQVPLPFTGLNKPGGVTLDSQGNVYVTDTGNSRTLKLPAGSSTQEELHFTGLDNPWGLAVDNVGTVYVGGRNNQIVALKRK